MTYPLILASTSRYRRELLGRLAIPFSVAKPDVDETQLSGESPLANCRRLAFEKASAVAATHPDAVVIGSDQVLDLDGVRVFGRDGGGLFERQSAAVRQR